ncbi:MAG: UbiA prenyltransferase family protein [Saprospiraceae bacterium]|nr:UbiA prenyltransferase family protein [Saprospiraceae bacterium]
MKHWIKNGFIFLPLVFAGRLDLIADTEILLLFISFCFASSSIYVLNDLTDLREDQLHPIKKWRPLASGRISKRTAFFLLSMCVLGMLLSLLLQGHAKYYVLAYFVLNIAYVFMLKQLPIVDVSCIAIGFVLRVMAGGAAADVFVSHWMIIMTFLLTISIAFSKRREDLITVLAQTNTQNSPPSYSLAFLDLAKSITFSITLIAYIFYSISPEVIARIGSEKLYLTSVFVFLGIMRYLQIGVINQSGGSPIEVLWKDRFLQIVIVLWAITFLMIIYGKLL